ncbi:M14 family zinc carboxypeptidase [Neolewinella agarilytica]|uniref:carboxypeptidase T n=1 Tax=Neolewinella agarilytica TaxID=478744 RepID=A0A1H9FPB2_9BACT|nr:M14 family zinc carboxypeptidase [Neolewinella agarilytica]SEQ39840.1 Por secretion system C-terminal sorting domain-containing protein [Neolewinella agarilytica]
MILRQSELPLLTTAGISYDLLTADVSKAIEKRNIADQETYRPAPNAKSTAGFELGSMGGFYTYAEVLQQLDEMYALYPSLITQRFSIGTTTEGRTIWAVKISDNPNTDESAAEAPVYFDALHHAREPASMATVINFMFHLLENYASDPGMNYVVNNREIFVVPVVNPDGYEYNRTTNPNGGGLWRKNRRVNSGSSCRGVDLNRNYDSDWGGSGSSSSTCSDSYRGPGPFSEPESQAIRDFTTSIGASIAYTTHTSGGYWLGPDFSSGQAEFAIHAELNGDCLDENDYIYGDADIILGYASGTTQNWMYESLGSLSWTPEIGTTGFWPSIPEIIPLVNEQIKPYEYACWVAGALADFQGFELVGNSGLSSAAPLEMNILIRNKGLSRSAQNVSVSVSTDVSGVVAINGSRSYGNIASRTSASNSLPFTFSVDGAVAAGTEVKFYVDVSQEGVISDRDSFFVTVGTPNVLFADDAESGSNAWSNGGSGNNWETSTADAYTGTSCFVDSRLSHTAGNSSRSFTTNAPISLAGTSNPRLEFAAKWGLHTNTDYVRLQVSVNGGSWTNIATPAMETISGEPAFVRNERWTNQVADLSAYSGQSVQFRFVSFSNSSLRSDGFYFDDFRVVDYAPMLISTCTDGVQNGSETAVDCGGPDCAPCSTCTDGVQNGSETAVDCGGPDCEPCSTDCTAVTLSSDDFEAGYGSWNDGGSDCTRISNATYANSGTISARIRDNTSSSVLTSDILDLSAYSEINVAFTYVPVSMDNVNEDFWLQVSTDGGSSYTIVEEWNRGDEFQNNLRYFEDVTIQGPFTANTRLRFRCDASGNSDWIYLDDIVVSSCPGGSGSSSCTDGIQNGEETGVDCGGPDCAPCPTCSDGIQNGGETGVDCGGPDCGDCDTCSDGIQNGDETGIDCGGIACQECPTCFDGEQNGNETGIDCGGPDCAACQSCTDGIQNGGETGVDCGGPDCAACPTCTDGIQNGNETGIDCGGPDCIACTISYCSSSANTQYEYIQSVTFAGTTNSSSNNGGYADFTGSTTFNLSGTVTLSLTPGFPGGSYNENWTVYVDYNADGDFSDAGEQVFQGASSGIVNGSFIVPGGLTGTSRMRIQMRYGSYNSSSCGSYSWGEVEDYTVDFGSGVTRRAVSTNSVFSPVSDSPVLELYPNPVRTDLTVRLTVGELKETPSWIVVDATGKVVMEGQTSSDALQSGLNIYLQDLSAGMYYFSLRSAEGRMTKRFIVQP